MQTVFVYSLLIFFPVGCGLGTIHSYYLLQSKFYFSSFYCHIGIVVIIICINTTLLTNEQAGVGNDRLLIIYIILETYLTLRM